MDSLLENIWNPRLDVLGICYNAELARAINIESLILRASASDTRLTLSKPHLLTVEYTDLLKLNSVLLQLKNMWDTQVIFHQVEADISLYIFGVIKDIKKAKKNIYQELYCLGRTSKVVYSPKLIPSAMTLNKSYEGCRDLMPLVDVSTDSDSLDFYKFLHNREVK